MLCSAVYKAREWVDIGVDRMLSRTVGTPMSESCGAVLLYRVQTAVNSSVHSSSRLATPVEFQSRNSEKSLSGTRAKKRNRGSCFFLAYALTRNTELPHKT